MFTLVLLQEKTGVVQNVSDQKEQFFGRTLTHDMRQSANDGVRHRLRTLDNISIRQNDSSIVAEALGPIDGPLDVVDITISTTPGGVVDAVVSTDVFGKTNDMTPSSGFIIQQVARATRARLRAHTLDQQPLWILFRLVGCAEQRHSVIGVVSNGRNSRGMGDGGHGGGDSGSGGGSCQLLNWIHDLRIHIKKYYIHLETAKLWPHQMTVDCDCDVEIKNRMYDQYEREPIIVTVERSSFCQALELILLHHGDPLQ